MILPTTFSYEGYAARLLTTQELDKACTLAIDNGSTKSGVLKNCNWLVEKTNYDGSGTRGYFLETPRTSSSSAIWGVDPGYMNVGGTRSASSAYGIRPVIEVSKINIEF